MVISLLHPSRGRKVRAQQARDKWLASAGITDIEYILSVDSDDLVNYLGYFDGLHNRDNLFILVKDNRSAVDAINRAAEHSSGEILVVMSDDFDCPDQWAIKILDVVKGKSDWILKTQDGIQPWIITMPVMDRTYYNRFGYVYHPAYLHMFCDTELSAVADLTGRKLTSNLLFSHNHYSTGASEKDAVSIKADATWSQGEKLFIERAKRKFDLKDTPGKITDQAYINWLVKRGIRL